MSANEDPMYRLPELAFQAMAATDTSRFNEDFVRQMYALEDDFGACASYDLLFLAFLRASERFGFFRLGPIVLEVARVEDAVRQSGELAANDYAEFSRLLMAELRRSGRPRLDELHFLATFMNLGKGIPSRVFGELAVTLGAVEEWLRTPATPGIADDLLTPEEVAEYLKVHVETVRLWIRSGRLPAYRLGGVRALRLKRTDVDGLLQRVDSASENTEALPGERG